MKDRSVRLVREAHRLARSYHWSEPDILRLGLRRRLAYLTLIDEEAQSRLIAEA